MSSKNFYKKLAFLEGFILVLLIGILFLKLPFKKISLKESEKTELCLQIPPLEDGALKRVTKVIDGDTFLIEGGYSVRILGIDADERGEPCYFEAKKKLEELILGKKVILKKRGQSLDRYCRYLREVFLEKKDIGKEMVKGGWAVARFFRKNQQNYSQLVKAEKFAQKNHLGCKWKIKKEASKFRWQKIKPEALNLKLIKACQAKNFLNQKVIVEGKIVDTYFLEKPKIVFLNFEFPYPHQCLKAVIFNKALKNFKNNPQNYFLNQTVRVYGKIKNYQGKPEIILETPSQIEIGH